MQVGQAAGVLHVSLLLALPAAESRRRHLPQTSWKSHFVSKRRQSAALRKASVALEIEQRAAAAPDEFWRSGPAGGGDKHQRSEVKPQAIFALPAKIQFLTHPD